MKCDQANIQNGVLLVSKEFTLSFYQPIRTQNWFEIDLGKRPVMTFHKIREIDISF